MPEQYDVVAIGAHPDDLEVVMGGTTAILTDRGLAVLCVDAESSNARAMICYPARLGTAPWRKTRPA